MNPVWKIKEEMEDEFNENKLCTINMFAYGKIIYDLDGNVKKLQNLALEYIDKPLKSIVSNKLDNNNYHIWDYLDELKVSLKENREDFRTIRGWSYYSRSKEYSEHYKLKKDKLYWWVSAWLKTSNNFINNE